MTSWLLFALSLLGVALTLNAYRPPRLEVLSVFTFFNGWLISEMPVQTALGQAVVTAVLVALGALHHTAGWAGLAIAAVSWIGLLGLVRRAALAGPVLQSTLDEALPAGWRTGLPNRTSVRAGWRERAQLIVPFFMHDRRVEVVRNVDYWGDGRHAHRLDIYRPREGNGHSPVLVYIHGGGWVIGDKREQGKPMMLHLASLGWVCVTINYRLSPKATWPDHLVDCKRALDWVRGHIADYGGDASFVAVSGGSAGGHLAALVGLDPHTAVDACVPFYGVYDFTNRDGLRGFGFGRFIERMVLKKRLSEAPELFRDASPMDQIAPGAPPFFVVHGANDTLVPVGEARAFVRLLRAAATRPVAYAELPGAQHAFEVFRSIRTAFAVDAVADFLEYVRAAGGDQTPAAFSSSAMDAVKSSASSHTSGIDSRQAISPTSMRSM